jgi:hypothetical protein
VFLVPEAKVTNLQQEGRTRERSFEYDFTTVQDGGSMRTGLCMRGAHDYHAGLPDYIITYQTFAAVRLNSLMIERIEQERNFLGKTNDRNK